MDKESDEDNYSLSKFSEELYKMYSDIALMSKEFSVKLCKFFQ